MYNVNGTTESNMKIETKKSAILFSDLFPNILILSIIERGRQSMSRLDKDSGPQY